MQESNLATVVEKLLVLEKKARLVRPRRSRKFITVVMCYTFTH
jgi:hypothetical protein